jgi:tetratricopeptide (TPR) repeat protein
MAGLDANYALAFANRALISWECATNSRQWLQEQTIETRVRADAEHAIVLAPALADGYLALSSLEQGLLHLEAADQACARALALAPGSAPLLQQCSLLAGLLGRFDIAIAGTRHAVALDPLNSLSHRALADTLRFARRYEEAAAAYQASIDAAPDHSDDAYGYRGISYYLAGNLSLAQATCEVKPDNYRSLICRAMVYERLGRHGDAATVLAQLMQIAGVASAYQYTEIQAQWGDGKAALDWLEKAMQVRDPGLAYTKIDPLLDPLRKEPRFQAIERELKFPN